MENGDTAGGGNMPPLIVNPGVSSVTPMVIKKEDAVTDSQNINVQPLVLRVPPGANTLAPNMRLVQTADGKKLLLTNVVKTTKPSLAPSNQPMLIPQNLVMLGSPPTQSQINPVASTNTSQTLILQPSTVTASAAQKKPNGGAQPMLVKVSGMNPPLMIKPNSQVNSLTVPNVSTTQVVNFKQNSVVQRVVTMANKTSTSFAKNLLSSPITPPSSLANPVVILSNEGKKYKVVGNPVPVRLHPKLQKIAPKGQAAIPPLRRVEQQPWQPQQQPWQPQQQPWQPQQQPWQPQQQPWQLQQQQIVNTPPPAKIPSSKPPAYLNIQVKEEPNDEPLGELVYVDGGVKIKDEPLDPQTELEEALENASHKPFVDVKIKEEPDEESELLERDEQLRKVLEVTSSTSTEDSPNKPRRFYIRSSEGKLISISPEEAEALGLSHEDKAEENQRKLLKALAGVGDFPLKKVIADQKRLVKSECIVLIPDNVDVKDFVSRNVPPAAEKEAALMKTLKCSSDALEAKFSSSKIFVPTKTNTTIIGEYVDNDVHFLKIHIETENGERDVCNIPKTPLNTYQCPFCKKDFKTKDHIISHIRVHTGERPYPCDICGKRYRQRIDIIRHMRIHTGEKPFTCGLCNVSFNQKSNLRSHMRIHTGERPVQCKICGKGFSRNTHLKQHMKLHTGEKPYSCQVCCRPFRFKSGLQAHERIHSGLKPYACSLCGRSFTQIVGLIRHERTHAGEKPFRCQSCGKSFNNRESLQFHVKKHTSERPYSCDLCKKTFTDTSALRCHRKKYHSNMLICVICFREDFKTRIELREHLRAHERENWEENESGDLVPRIQEGSPSFVSIDDTMENLEEGEGEENEDSVDFDSERAEEIQVEVELDVDDPIENDDEYAYDSDYEDQDLQRDPLVDPLI
ncbi:testis-specific zinc finger protein topi-like [Penaeus japonicus]|uniref:testis-specific zinc finger protein topi-like n=1 Tax=Penaeus japonicus TaxID=27405 RepID=UPI001C70C870|nr:testis-specific zinc finger protein topi-like [Penaeus japonicus]